MVSDWSGMHWAICHYIVFCILFVKRMNQDVLVGKECISRLHSVPLHYGEALASRMIGCKSYVVWASFIKACCMCTHVGVS